jgi:hypothetical protein
MQVFHARAARPRNLSSLATGLAIGGLLVIVGLALAYVAFATPFVDRFIPSGHVGAGDAIGGALGWTLALVMPAACVITGLARIVGAAETVASGRPRRSHVGAYEGILGDELTAATGIRLPDGRAIPELIVGPHGVAIFEALPPAAATRHVAGQWEVRTEGDRWVPIENPLDRASRDADRVRRWLHDGDRDFVVRVHAAVIATDASDQGVARTPSCAVIGRDQIPAFLASLPAQRSFNAERRAHVVDLVRSAI